MPSHIEHLPPPSINEFDAFAVGSHAEEDCRGSRWKSVFLILRVSLAARDKQADKSQDGDRLFVNVNGAAIEAWSLTLDDKQIVTLALPCAVRPRRSSLLIA